MVIDEFYGWLPWDYLLRLTDRYPFMVESKGGHIQFTSEIIIFTSNKIHDHWYKNQDCSPLNRRLDIIWRYEKDFTDNGENIIINTLKGPDQDKFLEMFSKSIVTGKQIGRAHV